MKKVKDVQNCWKWRENVSNSFLHFLGVSISTAFIQKFKMFGFVRNGEKCFPRYPLPPKKVKFKTETLD